MNISKATGLTVLVGCLLFKSFCDGQTLTTTNNIETATTVPQDIGHDSKNICRTIRTDIDFPSQSIWAARLPGVEEINPGTTTPDYRLRAKSVADVQAAIVFANDYNIRLTVICSGHDWLARSAASSGLLLDVSQLLDIRLLDSFVPSNTPVDGVIEAQSWPSPEVVRYAKIGAGWGSQALNAKLNESGTYANAGITYDICVAGGWSLYGGHGLTSSSTGLGVDDIVEFEAVTTTGEHVVANENVNSELFWAMLGGGSLAVRTSVTLRVHPTPHVTYTAWGFNTTLHDANYPENFWSAIELLHKQFPYLIEVGVTGYYYIFASGTATIRFITHGSSSPANNSQSILNPVFRQMEAILGLRQIPAEYTEYSTWIDFYLAQFGVPQEVANATSVPVSKGRVYSDSIILSLNDTQKPGLGQALAKAIPKFSAGQYKGHLVCGPAVWRPSTESRPATPVSPAWREFCATELLATGNPDGTITMDYLRDFLGKSGTYINEASPWQQDWKRSFWGDHYPQLAQIQEKFDPKGLLWSTPAVGADRYHTNSLGRICQAGADWISSSSAPLGENLEFPAVKVSGNLLQP